MGGAGGGLGTTMKERGPEEEGEAIEGERRIWNQIQFSVTRKLISSYR